MRNKSVPSPVSVSMVHHLKHIGALALLIAAVFIVGCKKDSGSAASSGKDTPITGSPADAPVALKPVWKPGNRYVMRLERNQTSQVPGMGLMGRRGGNGPTNNPAMETMYAQEYTLTVTNGPSDTRGAELEIAAIELQMSRGEETIINYDSQNKVAPREANPFVGPVLEAMDKLIGGKIYYQLGSDGSVAKVEGINELFARADVTATNAAAGARRRGAGGITALLRGSVNEDLFKQMLDLIWAPPHDVKIGDSWPVHKELTTPVIGKLSIDVTNTFRGWQQHENAKCARVEFTGVVAAPKTPANVMGARIALDNGVVSGHFWYDPAIGIARETASDVQFTVGGTLPTGRNTNAAPQTFKAPIHETTSVKLLEIKPAG